LLKIGFPSRSRQYFFGSGTIGESYSQSLSVNLNPGDQQTTAMAVDYQLATISKNISAAPHVDALIFAVHVFVD